LGAGRILASVRRGSRILLTVLRVALAFDDACERLYVWNHFGASLSAIDTASGAERQRLALFTRGRPAIRAGRALLYDTHRTSGLGQAECASCHVDAGGAGLPPPRRCPTPRCCPPRADRPLRSHAGP
jgi:hypothetical protein